MSLLRRLLHEACCSGLLNIPSHYKIQSEDMEQNKTSICESSCVIAKHAFTVHFISHSCRVIMSAEVRAHWGEMKRDLCSEHIFFSSGRKLDLHQTMIIALICTFLMTSTQKTERLIDENMKSFFVRLCWNSQVAHLYFIQQHFCRKCLSLWDCVREMCELYLSFSKCRTLQKQQQNVNTSGCYVSCTDTLFG